MRHFGHASPTHSDRPDSVNLSSVARIRTKDDDPEKLTPFQRFILGVGIVASAILSLSVAHGYYVWFLK